MKYLVDTNIWLNALQSKSDGDKSQLFIRNAPRSSLATTDFAVHSLGLVLWRRSPELYGKFLDDLIRLRVFTLHLSTPALREVLEATQRFQIDFDDAFQVVVAQRDDLTIVSLDADYDRTPRGRKTPAQVLADLAAS